jgi:DNA-directed RNA polymerase subunit M/transcription elongation factor TFIIS
MASAQTETAVVACPGCGSRLSVPKTMIGKRARCASCSLAFTIPSPAEIKPTLATAPAAPPQEDPLEIPEHVGFDCRVCNSRLFALTADVGKKLKCPDCGALTEIPPPPAPQKKNIPAAMEGEQYELWDADEQPLPSQLIAEQPKTVTLNCRRCDTVMHPLANHFGQPIKCPDCGTINIVPPPPIKKVRPSVIASDAQTPILDPAADPGERPLILAPVGKMLHEELHEEEYRRAVEKSQRTGKPMEIDRRGRPIMPRYPLLTGVFPFLFTPGALAVWVGITLGLGVSVYVLMMGVAMAASGGPFTGVPLIAGGSAMVMVAVAGTYSCLLQIIMESSEGNRTIHDWPSFTDWFGSLLYVGVAFPMSAVPGWAISQIPGVAADPSIKAIFSAVSALVFLPIVILSQLDFNSPAGLLSGRILSSMKKCPFSWILFYIEVAVIAAICGVASYLVEMRAPSWSFGLMIAYGAAMVLLARLLGRLAWQLAEATSVEEKKA